MSIDESSDDEDANNNIDINEKNDTKENSTINNNDKNIQSEKIMSILQELKCHQHKNKKKIVLYFFIKHQ